MMRTLFIYGRKFYQRHPNAITFWLLFFALYFPIVSFLAVSLVLFLYIFWPFQSYSIEVPKITSEQVIVISHGLKDSDQTWAQALKTSLETEHPNKQVITINWSNYADNAFTCAVNGRRIGNKLAKQMASHVTLKKITAIGHSCGAFVNYGVCETSKAYAPNVLVETIYLDPVSIYGGLFWNYGLNHFGGCADKSTTYYDTEDNVPGSGRAPVNSDGVDVTKFKKDYDYQGSAHHWPIYYYQYNHAML
ncbi:hypothetical protein [Thalassotalea sp. PLHSN55]|uniref:hypothetical protein n=1 Tax=Thalassotalea sp. PLHSN55 TaxID=3435888 RepID=UPI003F867CE5